MSDTGHMLIKAAQGSLLLDINAHAATTVGLCRHETILSARLQCMTCISLAAIYEMDHGR